MQMLTAGIALAALAGAAVDGYVDTKYAFNADGTPRSIAGASPGLAGGIVLAGAGVLLKQPLLAAVGLGALAGEGMRYVANKTASAMQSGTQGFPGMGVMGVPGLPQNSNARELPGASMHDFARALDRLDGLRRAA